MSRPDIGERPTTVYDLEGEDFFEKFNLKKVKFLKKGMSGKVFLVTPRNKPGRKLAVKIFSLSSEVREKSLRQFTTEAGVMQAVRHPHLVPCTMAARCHDYAAIAMPYYPGGDITFEGKQDPRVVQRYMCHVAMAVEHLHRNNIAHNDVKLGNVFLDASSRAHLGDFGLAMEVKDDSKTVIAGLVGGTRDYWSPEKLKAGSHDRIDPFKADIYAIGVMFWALVSGEDTEVGTDYLDRLETVPDLNLSASQSIGTPLGAKPGTETHGLPGGKDA